MPNISFHEFKSFDELKNTLLDHHIMIPETKSLNKLKMYHNLGYDLLYKDCRDVSSRIKAIQFMSAEDFYMTYGFDKIVPDWYKKWLKKEYSLKEFQSNRYKILKPSDFKYITELKTLYLYMTYRQPIIYHVDKYGHLITNIELIVI